MPVIAWLMVRILVAALVIGCGGGSGGGGGSPSLRQACTKLCTCFEETGSFSNGGTTCVDECVTSSGSFSFSNSNGETAIPQACIDCINGATCDGITSGSACTAECNF